jgi:hypothetical protein
MAEASTLAGPQGTPCHSAGWGPEQVAPHQVAIPPPLTLAKWKASIRQLTSVYGYMASVVTLQ